MSDPVTPDPEWLAIQQHVAKYIAETGRAVIWVEAEGSFPGFGYTIGNHLKGFPELLLINGGSQEDYSKLLNSLSKQMIERKRAFEDGELLKRNKVVKGIVYECHDQARNQYTWQVGQYFETDAYRVQQVVLADGRGLCPPNALCDPRFQVPVLRKLILSS